MGIGASIFLLAVGAILAFAVANTSLSGIIDLHMVGWILMVVGVIGLVVTLFIWGPRRRSSVVDQNEPAAYQRRVIDDDLN
jgi:tetrahydromethanopterin S-methyltransferase subunit E